MMVFTDKICSTPTRTSEKLERRYREDSRYIIVGMLDLRRLSVGMCEWSRVRMAFDKAAPEDAPEGPRRMVPGAS